MQQGGTSVSPFFIVFIFEIKNPLERVGGMLQRALKVRIGRPHFGVVLWDLTEMPVASIGSKFYLEKRCSFLKDKSDHRQMPEALMSK